MPQSPIRATLSSWILRLASLSGLTQHLQRLPAVYLPLRALLMGLVGKKDSMRVIIKGPLRGYRLCLGPNDRNAYLVNEHEQGIVEVVLAHCRPGMRVIDIGAHVGYFTLLCSVRVGIHGRVLTFEPNPTNFAKIRSMIELNSLKNVELLPYAVSDVRSSVSFSIEETGQMGHIADGTTENLNTITAEAVRLDDIMEGRDSHRVDFVKMDVEGAEPKALAGMEQVLRRWGPLVMCEWHPRVAGTKYAQAFDRLDYECTLLEPESPDEPFHILARPRGAK